MPYKLQNTGHFYCLNNFTCAYVKVCVMWRLVVWKLFLCESLMFFMWSLCYVKACVMWTLMLCEGLHYVKACVMWRLDDLLMRFEAPDSRNRWDSPAFVVQPAYPVPCDQIYDVLYHRQPPPPNLSTLPVRLLHSLIYVNLHY